MHSKIQAKYPKTQYQIIPTSDYSANQNFDRLFNFIEICRLISVLIGIRLWRIILFYNIRCDFEYKTGN